MKKVIISCAASVVLLVTVITLLICFNDPENAVEDYFDALKRKDYDVAYNMLVTDDFAAYLNRGNYINHVNNMEELKGYSIEKKGRLLYEVTCYYETYEKQCIVKLKKSKKKTWGIFNNYIVNPTDIMAENISITVPSQIEVKLNGIYIDSFLKGKADGMKKYVFPLMLKGDYTISVSGEVFNTYTQKVAISENNQIFEPELPYMKEEAIRTITDLLYTSVQSEYRQMIEENVNNPDGAYGEVDITDFWVTIEEYGYQKDIFTVQCNVEYNVELTKWVELTDTYTDMTYYSKEVTQENVSKKHFLCYADKNWILSK